MSARSLLLLESIIKSASVLREARPESDSTGFTSVFKKIVAYLEDIGIGKAVIRSSGPITHVYGVVEDTKKRLFSVRVIVRGDRLTGSAGATLAHVGATGGVNYAIDSDVSGASSREIKIDPTQPASALGAIRDALREAGYEGKVGRQNSNGQTSSWIQKRPGYIEPPAFDPKELPGVKAKAVREVHLVAGCPDAYGFACRYEGKPWPGHVFALTVWGHVHTSAGDLGSWLEEMVRELDAPRRSMPPALIGHLRSPLMLSYKEFTRKGLLGPSLAQFGCKQVLACFEEIAFLAMQLERLPAEPGSPPVIPALEFMKDSQGQPTTSGDVLWTLRQYLR